MHGEQRQQHSSGAVLSHEHDGADQGYGPKVAAQQQLHPLGLCTPVPQDTELFHHLDSVDSNHKQNPAVDTLENHYRPL